MRFTQRRRSFCLLLGTVFCLLLSACLPKIGNMPIQVASAAEDELAAPQSATAFQVGYPAPPDTEPEEGSSDSNSYPAPNTATPITSSYPGNVTNTPRATSTRAPTATRTPIPTATMTPMPTASPTGQAAATPTASETPTQQPTDESGVVPTAVATVESTATRAATNTPVPTNTPFPTATATQRPATLTPSPTETPTRTPRATATARPQATDTPMPQPTITLAPTVVPTQVANTPTPQKTVAALPTQAPTLSATATPANVATPETVTLLSHRVLPGENLFSIGRFYGVSVNEIVRVNGISDAGLIFVGQTIEVPVPVQSPIKQQPNNPVNAISHMVEKGETLGYLSVLYDVSVSRLVKKNGIKDPDVILVGTKLFVPLDDGKLSIGSPASPTLSEHTVRPGETLSGLSAFYDVPQRDLIDLNSISDPDVILIGTKLLIPGEVSAELRNQIADESAANDVNISSVESSSLYVVQTGDSLLGIAVDYSVSIFDLARLNGLQPDSYLFIDQELVLPANASVDEDSMTGGGEDVTDDAAAVAAAVNGVSLADSKLATDEITLADAAGNIYMIIEGNLVRINAADGTFDIIVPVEPVVDGQGAIPFGVYAGTGPTIFGSRAVIDFRVSDDEQTILVLRAYESADDITYDLMLVDSDTGFQQMLAANLPKIIDIEWTTDEAHVAFIMVGDEDSAGVFAVDASDPAEPTYVGSCQLVQSTLVPIGCQGLGSDANGDSILYVDGRGLWRGTFDGAAPDLLANYDDSNALIYDPIAWSADGRYLLMWGGYIEGGQRFVYDSETERVTPVPFSSSYIFMSAVSWVGSDRLLVIAPSVPGSGQRPVASLFDVDGDSDEFLVLDRDILIPTVDEYEFDVATFAGVQVWSPDAFAEDTGPFAIISSDSRESGVYMLDLSSGDVKRLNGLPDVEDDQYVREVVWAPDNKSALLVYSVGDETNRVFWISAETATPIELPLSEQVCCVDWK